MLRGVADALVGKEIGGQFRVLTRIGSGGMGSVYKAEQPDMNRLVAVKVLHAKHSAREDVAARFRREARAMSQLSHPHTARVFLYGQLEDGSSYFVMEFMQGHNLAQEVRANGPMEEDRAINVMVQVCGALDEAHRAGIVHRDLKPENIFLTEQGGITDFAKVLDFGLAKVTPKQMRPDSLILTQKGMVFGTPEFMSPEQAQGKALDARSDIYSLGLILYELLTGKLPFDAQNAMDFMSAQVSGEPIPLNSRVAGMRFSTALEGVLMKALEKKPEHRYRSAADFAQALKGCLQGPANTLAMEALPSEPSGAPHLAPPKLPREAGGVGTRPPVRSAASLVVLGAAIGLAVAALLATLVWALQ